MGDDEPIVDRLPSADRFWHRDFKYFDERGSRGVCKELKTPYVVDGLLVFKRRLPDGMIMASFGPFASAAVAERFVVERMQQAELKPYQVGDLEHDS